MLSKCLIANYFISVLVSVTVYSATLWNSPLNFPQKHFSAGGKHKYLAAVRLLHC